MPEVAFVLAFTCLKWSFVGFSLRIGWVLAGFCGSVVGNCATELGDLVRSRRGR